MIISLTQLQDGDIIAVKDTSLDPKVASISLALFLFTLQNADDFQTTMDKEILDAVAALDEEKRELRKNKKLTKVSYEGSRRKETALTIHVPTFE